MTYKISSNGFDYSFGFLKPDCVQRDIIEEVYAMINEEHLEVLIKKRMRFIKSEAELLYREWQDKSFFERAVNNICCGPIEAFIVRGRNAISKLEDVVGGSHSQDLGNLNTIRSKYAITRTQNTIHSTSDLISLKREVLIVFSAEEIKSVDGLSECILDNR